MSTIRIEDVCIWPKHIEGDTALCARLLDLPDGEVVILRIGGTSRAFRKMTQGKNVQATPGLRPACDTTKAWWQEVYATSKGSSLPIAEVVE